MLNYFRWYSISWVIVLILYFLNFSDFNIPLDGGIIVFAVVSSIISGILSWIFRDKFKESSKGVDKKKKKTNESVFILKGKRIKINRKLLFYAPVILFSLLAVIEFFVIRQVPFLKVVFLKEAYYQEVNYISGYHVALMVTMTYAAVRYIYEAIHNKSRMKHAIICVTIILFIFLLYLTRSYIIVVSFIGLLLLVAHLFSTHGLKFKYIALSAAFVVIGLFGFGVFGNVRHGYKWDDAIFLEQIGLYERWPAVLPKQLMWAYSYATTPLANLNYNIDKDGGSDFSMVEVLGELLPDSVTKIFISEKKTVSLIKPYFTASTGYARVYLGAGYFGLYVMFGFLMFVGIIGIVVDRSRTSKHFLIFSGFLSAIYAFMMFDNMLGYVGLSIPCIISFCVLVVSEYRARRR